MPTTVIFNTGEKSLPEELQRKETWDDMSARFHSWIKPGTPPLEEVHELYETRVPRV